MTALVELPEFEGQGEVLKPYVPRLLIEWVRDFAGDPHTGRWRGPLHSWTSPGSPP